MRTYTRARLLGAIYFFTVNLAERHGNDLLTSHIDALRAAFRVTKQAHPLVIEAAVILPDHLHCLWRLASIRWIGRRHWTRLIWCRVNDWGRCWDFFPAYLTFKNSRPNMIDRY